MFSGLSSCWSNPTYSSVYCGDDNNGLISFVSYLNWMRLIQRVLSGQKAMEEYSTQVTVVSL